MAKNILENVHNIVQIELHIVDEFSFDKEVIMARSSSTQPMNYRKDRKQYAF